jgi:uncharacterized protein DUF3619
MTDNEHEFGKKIGTYLDSAAAGLKSGTAYRLQLARHEALARLGDPVHATDLRLAGAYGGTGTASSNRTFRAATGVWAGILLMIVVALAFKQWQDYQYQQLRDVEETDAAILSSDLPIDAYLDRGFQNWLKHAVDE